VLVTIETFYRLWIWFCDTCVSIDNTHDRLPDSSRFNYDRYLLTEAACEPLRRGFEIIWIKVPFLDAVSVKWNIDFEEAVKFELKVHQVISKPKEVGTLDQLFDVAGT